jgi:hypothetical protein
MSWLADELVQVVSNADAVLVTASYATGGPPAFNVSVIAAMKPTTVAFNVSWGAVINIEAALAAVRRDQFGTGSTPRRGLSGRRPAIRSSANPGDHPARPARASAMPSNDIATPHRFNSRPQTYWAAQYVALAVEHL